MRRTTGDRNPTPPPRTRVGSRAIPSLALALGISFPASILAADIPLPEKPELSSEGGPPPASTRLVEGWRVEIHSRLWDEDPVRTATALELLGGQLREIARVLPSPALARLREVTLWFSPEYPGVPPRAEYHPGEDWLRANRRNPAMAKGIEFTNLRIFEAESRRMPNFALHELAHAYHDRVLPGGFGNPDIRAAYERVRSEGRYDRVTRHHGDGRPRTEERAYALANPMEYFAETTEAFFARNDYYPFERAELRRHDPETDVLLVRLWGVTRQEETAPYPAHENRPNLRPPGGPPPP